MIAKFDTSPGKFSAILLPDDFSGLEFIVLALDEHPHFIVVCRDLFGDQFIEVGKTGLKKCNFSRKIEIRIIPYEIRPSEQ